MYHITYTEGYTHIAPLEVGHTCNASLNQKRRHNITNHLTGRRGYTCNASLEGGHTCNASLNQKRGHNVICVGSSTCFGCSHPSSVARTALITASGID